MKKTRVPREKWHTPHALAEVRESLRKKAKRRIANADGLGGAEITRVTRVSLHINFGCDLRATLEEKSASSNMFAAWTAFVNKAGTLVHIVPKDGDLHIRIPLYYSVANKSVEHVERVIGSYICGRLL